MMMILPEPLRARHDDPLLARLLDSEDEHDETSMTGSEYMSGYSKGRVAIGGGF